MAEPGELPGLVPARCHLAWGRHGTREAARRGDVLVIVDTLRFSSAAITAVQHGGVLFPCTWEEDVSAFARRVGGVAAVRRGEGPERGGFSLPPLSYLDLPPGTRVVLPSPNGATCSRYGREVPYLFVGALLNARAVGAAVSAVLAGGDPRVTVICCGERWEPPNEDGALRFAIEDYLGAGAVLSYLPHTKSPEARVCAGAFRDAQPSLASILWECESGHELREKGRGDDVRHAAHLDLYDAVPVMRGECLERWRE